VLSPPAGIPQYHHDSNKTNIALRVVTEQRLRDAVKALGVSADKVREWLKK
jgi:hypothetical protein